MDNRKCRALVESWAGEERDVFISARCATIIHKTTDMALVGQLYHESGEPILYGICFMAKFGVNEKREILNKIPYVKPPPYMFMRLESPWAIEMAFVPCVATPSHGPQPMGIVYRSSDYVFPELRALVRGKLKPNIFVSYSNLVSGPAVLPDLRYEMDGLPNRKHVSLPPGFKAYPPIQSEISRHHSGEPYDPTLPQMSDEPMDCETPTK